jgi:ribosome-binding factor A
MDQRRVERLSEQIRLLISDILDKDISDPRLELVNINRIRLVKDGSFATVFYSRLGSESDIDECEAAMNSASGFIRRGLSARMSLRTVPKLRFVYDRSLEEGERILGIIRKFGDD